MRKMLVLLCLAAVLTPVMRAAEGPDAGERPAVTDPKPATTPEATPAAAPATAAAPAAVVKPDISIADAVEGILDEDEPTRKKAFLRLETADANDVPALEKFEDAKDPEIKRQVALVLQRLRRGEVAFVLKYADGTPAANQKVNVKLTEIKMPEEDKKESSDPKAQAAGQAGNGAQIQVQGNAQVQVQILGPRAGGVIINGRAADGKAMPTYKEVLSTELTTDAQGKVSLGHFNDGKYQYQLTVSDGVPGQNLNGQIDLTGASQPKDWEILHGVTAKVTVLDADGKPVVGATVYDLGANGKNMMKMLQMQGAVATRWMGQMKHADTDENGVATLEAIGMQQITLAILKDGYEVAVQENVEHQDGKPLALSLKLEKTQPLPVIFKPIDNQKTDLTGLRFLAIPQKEYDKIIGAANPNAGDEAETLTADKFDGYVKAGALDLGKLGENGELSATLLPDTYSLVAAADGKPSLLGLVNVPRNGKNPKIAVRLRKAGADAVNQNGVARGNLLQAQPMPAPAPVPQKAGPVEDKAEKK